MASLPAEVHDRANLYLDVVDQARPGLVSALYVVGSAALGAWQQGHSDIDTVIVTALPLTQEDLVALQAVHAAMPEVPKFDGIYLDQSLFDRRPADCRVVPFVVNGEFKIDKPCGELNPVVWLILQRYGAVVRGPQIQQRPLPELNSYNLDNLRGYWQGQARGIHEHLAGQPADAPVDGNALAWNMLGPVRLHYTLATGDVVSKAGSAAYLAENFPAWADLAERAAGWRAGAAVEFTVGDLRDCADSIDAIAEDAWKRFG